MFLKLLLIICTSHLITGITGQCRIELPQETLLKPRFFKAIGSHVAVVSNNVQWIDMQNSEMIKAQCDTKFIKPNPTVSSSVNINCENGQIQGYYSSRVYFECDSLNWNLYESTKPFRWCPSHAVSYVIARPYAGGYDYLAGVCYDFLDMSVISLHHMHGQYLPPPFKRYLPSIEIKNIAHSFVSRNVSALSYDNEQIQQWMQFANYQNHSLIQNPKLYRENYQQFGGLLEFIWWTALRLGNWRHYEEALALHLEQNKAHFDILSGISGYVSFPIFKKESCQQNYTMQTVKDRTHRKIPLYVWHYLKSSRNDSENLVVIGVNSPFQEFYDPNDLIFCEDICHQIEWLKEVHQTFHFKTLGTIFCCTVAEVQASHRLNGFPIPPKTVKIIPLSQTLSAVKISKHMDNSYADPEVDESETAENSKQEDVDY